MLEDPTKRLMNLNTLDSSLYQYQIYRQQYYSTIQGSDGSNVLDGESHANAIYGNGGNDTLNGYAGNDLLDGGIGNDKLDGGIGNDKLFGGDGNDTLLGGDGNDYFVGGAGYDKMVGGAGHDTVDYSTSTHGVYIDMSDGNFGGHDDVSGIEDFIGSLFDDDVDGNDDANLMKGGAGNDNLWGGAGNDTILGEEGDDYLFGGTGANIIDGGNGNDHIHAGGGNYDDVVTGGAGADTFHWQVDVVNGHDIITDFDPLADALELNNPYGNGSANVFVNTSADGDVVIAFGNSTVELNGVQNQGWASIQDLQNAGWNINYISID
ncbi:hypothetical protein [Dongia sp.]|uniref:calcium-binding protein n=1 Tax=Dongia sp. TaxID=1977262 RepID=UPI0035B1A55C